MKKIICIFVTVLMVVSVSASAMPSEEQLEDLKEYGIMVGDEDGEMRLEDTITRAEATKMICVVQGINVDSFSNNIEPSAFPDVPDSHWAKNYINVMKDVGIVEGDEKGNFNPEAEVTNEEIIKILVKAIGYAPMADQTGGFPMGYTRTAQKLGITADMELEVNQPAIRGNVAQMFAAVIDIPLMVQSAWNADGTVEYQIADGSTGMEKMTLRIMHFDKK
ncbi:MAG: S-layer homology domain-containing protein [Clostridia bacterium]|nr:S-layer homology domain-containing protein [Oscillospiraceae bacterium]MBQ7960737.1 S-layer homology domain-containing protein [Clostridia bacterium]